MDVMKEIKLTLIKNKDGYTIGNQTAGKIDLASDDDEGRAAVVKILVEDFLNAEVEGGKKYK